MIVETYFHYCLSTKLLHKILDRTRQKLRLTETIQTHCEKIQAASAQVKAGEMYLTKSNIASACSIAEVICLPR